MGGVSALGDVPGPKGVTWSLGGSAPGGVCVCSRGVGGVCSRGCTWSGTPPLRGQTHACKHITLPKLRLRAVIIPLWELASPQENPGSTTDMVFP